MKGQALKKRMTKVLLYVTCTALLATSMVLLGFLSVCAYGKSSLYQVRPSSVEWEDTMLELSRVKNVELEEIEDGWVLYNEKLYRYTKEILTFLIMGIEEENGIEYSDVMYLVVCNPNENEMNVIPIDGNTIAKVAIHQGDSYIEIEEMQIALQYQYGDGKEFSCERSVDAVSDLFHQIPIHGYVALHSGSTEVLNDVVGSNSIERLSERIQTGLAEKSDVSTVIAEILTLVRKDMSLVGSLYTSLSPYMTTDITLNEVIYLLSTIISLEFSQDNIYELEKEVVDGTIEEVYLNKEAFYGLIMEVFYEEVTNPEYGY